MKFDIDSARKAGYSDDEIADYLATENKFDLSGAIESGYSARDVIDFLAKPAASPQRELPADITPSAGRSATPMGQADPRIVDNRGIIQRVSDYLKPAPKSVMEGYVPTPDELQADVDRRLSYGAGPISSQTAAQADLVRSGMAKTDSPTVKKVAKAMEEQGAPSFGDLIERAKSPVNERAARDAKAEEFRAPGEWAVDTLSNLGQGVTGLVQMPVNIIAPSSGVAEILRETQKELQAAESDVLKANRERLKERVLSEDGFFDRYVATVKELVTNPTLSISEAAKQVPNFLGIVGAARLAGAAAGGTVALAGRASPTVALGEAISGGAIQTAARAAGVTAGGAGASMIMAGGDAAGSVYETLTSKDPEVLAAWKKNADYQRLLADKIESGMDRKDASREAIEELATTKARMAALITAPLGLLGYAGAEAAIASKGLGRATAEALTARGMAKTAAKDLAGEQLEEGGTQFGGNVISKTVNPNQSLTEGVPEAMGTALVTSAPFAAAGVRSQYKEAMQGNEDQTIAARVGDMIIGQERQDPRLINPMDTIRTEDQVGPNAPSRAGQMMSFTEPDSATAQAGLTPIVVPVPTAPAPEAAAAVEIPPVNPSTEQQFGLDKLRMGATNVSTGGAVDAQPSVGGVAGGDQLGGGLDVSRPDVAGAAGAVRGRTGGPATDAGQALAAGDGAAQQGAGVTPQGYNNAVAQPVEQWFGRKGDGYTTEADARQALPGRQRMFKDLEWKIEPMPNGKFRLAGYEPRIETPGVAGEKIDEDWTQFAPESGTRGIPRAEMPQVKSNQRGALVNFLAARGITSTQEEVPASELKPTQAEFSPAKVKSAKDFPYGDRSILVSSDNHVVDGHHQWLAKLDANEPVKIIRLSAPIDEVIGAVREFPSSTTAEGATLGTQAPQAQQTETQGQEAAGAGAIAAAGPAGAPAQLQGGRVPGLTPAPTAPLRDFTTFQKAVAADGIEIAPLRAAEMNTQHQIASAVARVLGKTYTVARVTSGDPMALSNGMIDKLGGKHIVAAENSDDAPLFVAIHEAYHGLPEQQRKALNTQLLQLFRAENKDRFLKEFRYTEAQFEEEAPAFIAQVVSKRADFWEELRTKMGNREFADVAKLVLGTLNQIVRKVTSQYGKDFADTYITDIVKARDLLSTAYAEAMREQGLQPDVEVDTAVMASNKADIGAALQQRVDNDFDALVQEYNALRGTEGGRILDTDIARELSPEYRADRSRSAEVHEAASAFIQKLFDTRMATAHNGEYVAFMAGGGGSGKSSAQSLLGDEFTGASTVLDGTLSSEAKARRNIQTVLDSGRAAVIMYVYREPVEALRNGVLTRAMRGGRTVPIDALVKGHAGASEVVRNLQAEYAGNPDVTIIAIDNSRGPGNIVRSDLANITPVIKSGLKERFINAATEEFENGRVSETVYRATIGDAGAQAQVAREDAQGAQGDRREAGQGREPEGSGDAVSRSNRAKKAGSYTYTVDDKGRITVMGDADRIRFLTKAIAKGTVTPDGEAVMFRSAEADAAIKALKSEPKADPTIAANIQKQLDLSDEELASTSLEYQTGEPKDRAFVAPLKGGVPETVQFLEERRRASGLRLLDIAKPEDQDTLAKLIAAETMAAIRSSGNALEWYDETIAKTLAMAAVKYPELGRNVNAQTAFRLGMAIASQGLNVENNLKLAMRQYEAFRNTGKFPEMGEGESAEAMAGNFRLANELMAEMGPDLFRRFLATPFTIGELNSAGFDPGGELVDEEVLGSSVFGPKIGFGFYSNLNGNFEPVTMDMWFMRTMGRLTGYLRAFDAEKFSGQIKRFRDSFDQRSDDGVYADQFDADLIEAARTDQDSAIALARQVKKAHEKDFKTNREAFDAKQRKKTSLVLAAETMIQSIDKPKDVPGNGTERRQMRQVVRKAVDLVEQAYGQRVPPAAMQALIWYPEQELYKALGVKLSVTSQDYAGATEKVLKDEGYDEQQLRTAAKSGARRVRQANARDERRAAQGDGQRAGRSGPLEGAERTEFVRSRYEQAQLEKERLNPTRKGVVFEVAPDPNNEELTNRWRSLEQSQRLEISERVAREIVPKVLGQFQSSGIVAAQVGSYLDDTNPSFTVLLDKGDAVDIAKQLGFVLAQDSMMVVSPKPFKGGDQVGAIAIELGNKTAAEVDQIYKTLREIEVNGTKPVAGQSMANGVMTILNYSDVPTQQLAILVDQKLNKRYTVMTRDVFAAFPEKKEYDYGRETDDGRGSRADLRKGARALRTEATAALERELAGVTVRRSNRTTGPAESAGRPSVRSDQGDAVKIAGAVHYAKQERLSVLNGARFGTGIKGAEQKRLSEQGVDPRIKRRVYFYLPVQGGLPQAELGLGGFVYTADLSNLYDPSAGSRRFPTTPNEFESAVLDAGFRGYINREQGTAVVLNSDVPVKYQGPAAGQTIVQRKIERAAPAVATRTEGDELVRRPSGDELTGIIKARPALAQAAPSFKLQFGEARVLASEAAEADRVLAEAGAGFQFGAQQEDVNSPFDVVRSNRVKMAPIEEPGQFDAKPGDVITVVRLASMQGLDNANAASVKGLYTFLSMVDDGESAAGSEAADSDTIFIYKVKVPEAGFGEFSRARRGRLLDSEGVGRMKAKWGGYWYSFPQGTQADLIGSVPLSFMRDTAEATQGSNNFDFLGTDQGSQAMGQALKDAGFDFDEGGVMFSRRAQTDTPAFKRWFGDSKVVDENGEPLVVYHGTKADITAFDPKKIGSNFKFVKGGFFFSSDPVIASDFAAEFGGEFEGANVLPVYLSIQNPLTLDKFLSDSGVEMDEFDSLIELYDWQQPEVLQAAKAGGYDGVIFDQGDDKLVVAFRPEQIKSATGNEGTFDPENPSILKSNRARQDAEVVKMFEDLQNARGLKLIRAQEAIADHPMGEQIAKIHNDFYDILERLDEAGLIEINCK